MTTSPAHILETQPRVIHRLAVPADLSQLTPLRDTFRRQLARTLPPDAVEDWQLAISELATNAILHGAGNDPSKTISIEWFFEKTSFHLAVLDPGTGPPPEKIASPALPDDPFAESGRGLFIVASFADQFRGFQTPDGFRTEVVKSYPELGELFDLDPELERALEELSSCYESLSIFNRLANHLQQIDQLGSFINDALEAFRNLHPHSEHFIVCHPDAPSAIRQSLVGQPWFVDCSKETSPISALGALRAEATPDDEATAGFPSHVLPIVGSSISFGVLISRSTNGRPHRLAKALGTLRTLADLCGIACANHHLTLRRQQARIRLRELEIAVDIQKSLLPLGKPPDHPHLATSLHQASSLEVSGDYAEARIDPNGTLVVAVIDVMGKGVAAALLASIFRTAFDLTHHLSPASTILETLNRTLCQQLGDVTMFITCAVARFSPNGESLDFASAGHCPGLIFRNGQAPLELEASGPPLGLFPGVRYHSSTQPFKPGDRLVLLTDGTYEWDRSTSRNPESGWHNLLSFLSSHRTTPPATIWQELIQNIRTQTGPNLEDDCTLVVVDSHTQAPPSTHSSHAPEPDSRG